MAYLNILNKWGVMREAIQPKCSAVTQVRAQKEEDFKFNESDFSERIFPWHKSAGVSPAGRCGQKIKHFHA